MPRTCIVTGRRVRSGNRVSHANNKNKRVFRPNLKKKAVLAAVGKAHRHADGFHAGNPRH